MQFDYSKLLGRIRECGMTQESLAVAIGISITTLNLKLNNKAFFTQPEIKRICSVLEIGKDEIGEYFFILKVQKN